MPHYSQPSHSSKSRGYRLCDQCGSVERHGITKFRLCGGCMITQYCSPECQKAHWASHKAICQHTSQIQQQSLPSTTCSSDIAKSLRKFTSSNTLLLSWVGYQALDMTRHRENCRRLAVVIDFDDAYSQFKYHKTHIVPLQTYVTDPLVVSDIQRREARSLSTGGIGCVVVMIQCKGISQVIPFETDAGTNWPARREWEEVLKTYVNDGNGSKSFRPF